MPDWDTVRRRAVTVTLPAADDSDSGSELGFKFAGGSEGRVRRRPGLGFKFGPGLAWARR